MPKQGLIYRILIASPSDVIRERQIITESIYSWNATHSLDSAVILDPVRWETHSRPELGDRPQGIINKQLVQHCDLLIGAFWTRLGTNSGKATSGTVEEIEEIRKAGKPVLLYFSSAPVVPESLDIEQYKALTQYKASLKPHGLYGNYDDIATFQSQLQRHLASTMNELLRADNLAVNEGENVIEAPTLPKLSKYAQELLLEAAEDQHGIIMYISTLGGEHIQTHGKTFGSRGNARETAQWIDAVKQLTTHDFIESQGYKGELYQVTTAGYEIADRLREQQSNPQP